MPRMVWFVAGVALLAGACAPKPDSYPPEVVENFLKSCEMRSKPRVCRCGLDALQDRFSVEQFRGFEAQLRKGEAPKEMMDAIAGCRE
jgi:hypothetical protein